MFSGIVETIGEIIRLEKINDCLQLTIQPSISFADLNRGDSVAINGVCLTVIHYSENDFTVSAVPETLRLTNLGYLSLNSKVNLERSIKVGDRIGGHYVQGHVDTVGEILDLQQDGKAAWLLKISIPPKLAKYVVNKGYITIDGMSITVIDANDNWFTITLIPHTQAVTIAKHYQIGTKLNLEVDILSKYVEKLTGVCS